MSKTWLHFDQMNWPLPQCEDGGLQWRIRYAFDKLSYSDMLGAAEIMCAYHALIFKSQKDRNAICKRLKAAIRGEAP